MKRALLPYFLVFLLLLPASAAGQRPRRNRGAESVQDTPRNYESLIRQRSELTAKEAQLKNKLDEARGLFSPTAPGNEALGNKIVELENNLFALRSQLDDLDTVIASMEETETDSVRESPTESGKAMIVANRYFYENLSGDDYALLLTAQRNEQKADRLLGILRSNYDQLSVLIPVYYLAEKGQQADSLFSRIDRLAAENEILADSIGSIWSTIFDTKIYAYNYILDKCGEKELLAEQERQMNNLLMLQSEIEGEYMYEEAALYALQKLLTTGYEQRLADIAGLREAADSLGNLIPPTSHIEDYFLPVIDTRERMFYDFADVEITRPARYSSANPIPPVEIFPRGDIYRILLGAYSKAQPVSAFRGAYPLSHEVKNDRKHYYYAGGYRIYTEAQDAAARLKRSGFRNPRIVAWHDGRYHDEPVQRGPADGGNTKKPDNRVHYMVEITGAGDNLSRVVKDVIAKQGAGKEISRSSDPVNGESVFVVGAFNNRSLAESLVNEILSVDPGLSVTLVSVP